MLTEECVELLRINSTSNEALINLPMHSASKTYGQSVFFNLNPVKFSAKELIGYEIRVRSEDSFEDNLDSMLYVSYGAAATTTCRDKQPCIVGGLFFCSTWPLSDLW